MRNIWGCVFLPAVWAALGALATTLQHSVICVAVPSLDPEGRAGLPGLHYYEVVTGYGMLLLATEFPLGAPLNRLWAKCHDIPGT